MLSFYCLLYLICLPGFTDQKILGISVPVNLCFNQSSFLLYWQKVRFYIRFFPVNKDCNRDMARFPPVFDTNPPATACYEAHISNVSFLNENLLELYRLCKIQTENPDSPRL